MTIPEKNVKTSIFSSFSSAKLVWNLLEKNGDCYAFQSFNWLKTWYEKVGIVSLSKVCIALIEYPPGVPLMLLPLGIESRGKLSCLVWLGGRISDYHAPLLSKNCAEKLTGNLFQSIWQDILAELPPFDAVCFEKLPEFIADQRNPFLFLSCIPNASSAHFTQLSGSFESFLKANRSSRSISTEKRKQRRLSEHGKIAFTVAIQHEDITRFLEKMIRQKTRSYKEMGVSILFEKPGFQEFFETMSRNHIKNNFVHLSALTIDDRILATHWGLVYKNRFYHLFPTFEQCEFTKYSPGNILLWNLLEWCIENNIEIYDFTVGDEPYKDHWCDNELRLFDFYRYNTKVGMVYITTFKTLRILKRIIKHSPLLWQFTKWIRSKLASARIR